MFERAKMTIEGTAPAHLKERFRYLDSLVPAVSTSPWQQLTVIAVGWLWRTGFASGSNEELFCVPGVNDALATRGRSTQTDETEIVAIVLRYLWILT